MMLSPHFSLDEFCRSATAVRLKLQNNLPADLLRNVRATVGMLELIRDHLSKQAGREIPMRITSGYRSLALNRAIGSEDTSDHVKAFAADWIAPAFGSPTDICEALVPAISLIGIGQLINEFPDSGAGWVHTSARLPDEAINRIITITRRGKTVGIMRHA
jgi:zinc D-Ala-D-Ala carboxypeptidase